MTATNMISVVHSRADTHVYTPTHSHTQTLAYWRTYLFTEKHTLQLFFFWRKCTRTHGQCQTQIHIFAPSLTHQRSQFSGCHIHSYMYIFWRTQFCTHAPSHSNTQSLTPTHNTRYTESFFKKWRFHKQAKNTDAKYRFRSGLVITSHQYTPLCYHSCYHICPDESTANNTVCPVYWSCLSVHEESLVFAASKHKNTCK